jgi:hypothetical protein
VTPPKNLSVRPNEKAYRIMAFVAMVGGNGRNRHTVSWQQRGKREHYLMIIDAAGEEIAYSLHESGLTRGTVLAGWQAPAMPTTTMM